ncbi:hypothetical protein RMATCC62417_11902 [Rhizopus microsporus]|nr:hypothetical protein RMATCC62417_11902 [Rhizopus microsporus]
MHKASITSRKRWLLYVAMLSLILSITFFSSQQFIIATTSETEYDLQADNKLLINLSDSLNTTEQNGCNCQLSNAHELDIEEKDKHADIDLTFPPLPKETLQKINKNLLKDRILIVAAANYGMRNHVYNWIESLKRVNETKFIIFCLDDKLYDHLALTGYTSHAAKIPDTWFRQEIEANFSLYFSETYRIITHAKTLVVQQLLYLDVTVFFSDVDIVWRRTHIVDYVSAVMNARPSTETLFQQEGVDQREINSGFYLMRPTSTMKRLLAETITIQDTSEKMTQQGAMNAALDKLDLDIRTGPVGLLDLLHFPNGYVYFDLDLPRQHGIEPFIVHANYLIGEDKKKKLIEFNMWYLNDTWLDQMDTKFNKKTKSMKNQQQEAKSKEQN